MYEEFRKPYTVLFNAVTDAIRALDAGQAEKAKALLIQGQQQAEEAYIAQKDSPVHLVS